MIFYVIEFYGRKADNDMDYSVDFMLIFFLGPYIRPLSRLAVNFMAQLSIFVA